MWQACLKSSHKLHVEFVIVQWPNHLLILMIISLTLPYISNIFVFDLCMHTHIKGGGLIFRIIFECKIRPSVWLITLFQIFWDHLYIRFEYDSRYLGLKSWHLQKFQKSVNGRWIHPFNKGLRIYGVFTTLLLTR